MTESVSLLFSILLYYSSSPVYPHSNFLSNYMEYLLHLMFTQAFDQTIFLFYYIKLYYICPILQAFIQFLKFSFKIQSSLLFIYKDFVADVCLPLCRIVFSISYMLQTSKVNINVEANE